MTSTGDHQGWTPIRPLAVAAPTRPSRPALPQHPQHPQRDASPGSQAPLRRRRRAVPMARATALGYLALAVVIATIAGVGSALQPVYGTLPPVGGIATDDLRTAPTAQAWSLDLGSVLAPGAPTACLGFTNLDVHPGLSLVQAVVDPPEALRTSALCAVLPGSIGSRVALLDTASGRIRWVHDVVPDLRTRESVAVTATSTFDAGSRILIQASSGSQVVVESLVTTTGKVVDSTGLQPWTPDDRFATSGSVVATGSLSADGLSYVYRLRNADRLSKVVWSGAGNPTATMIPLSDRLLLGAVDTMQIPLATGVPTRWGNPIDASLGFTIRDDVLFVPNTRGIGVTTVAAPGFTAVAKTGRVLWRSRLSLGGAAPQARSCLVASNAARTEFDCLDYATGKTLWSRAAAGATVLGELPGQRSDDLYSIVPVGPPRAVILDGRSGHEKFSTRLPAGSAVEALGQTVGYDVAGNPEGSRRVLGAFDLASGRTLWQKTSPSQFAIWGGHLIEIGIDGHARRLVTRARITG